MATPVTFNEIQIGKQFSMPAGIIYQKVSTTEAKPILDAKGKVIANGRVSSAFYNTPILVTPVN